MPGGDEGDRFNVRLVDPTAIGLTAGIAVESVRPAGTALAHPTAAAGIPATTSGEDERTDEEEEAEASHEWDLLDRLVEPVEHPMFRVRGGGGESTPSNESRVEVFPRVRKRQTERADFASFLRRVLCICDDYAEMTSAAGLLRRVLNTNQPPGE
jgi:hypothetical protein